ncbi:MAG: ABC transporter substrate-binding protein, partial [Thermodesulfobacteriota bacterium]|nr:ABC transporter substrate-binding protein [Thermodesulfobacteriota bacterium]
MMMKRNLLWTILFIAVSSLFIDSDATADKVRGVTDTKVKVGIMGDLTGPVAAIWIPCANALKDYFRHVNDSGGIHGRKVKPIIEDDRYSIPLALSAFKKLVFRDKVLVLMAASGVGHTHSLIPL